MNILVVNDDGIRVEGIRRLVEALAPEANVYVCAPHIQRSATGHGISIGTPLEARDVDFDNAKLAIEITGTPVDCVKLGLNLLAKRGIEIDMLFSGINHGGNLGTDTLYSGTVSAAREGCFCGKPSVAVSVNSHKPAHFEMACELALRTLRNAYGKLGSRAALNINTPDVPIEKIRGVKITRLGEREYIENFIAKENEEGVAQYWYSGEPVIYTGLPSDIDVIAMQEGYATITPLHYDLTDYKLLEEVKSWALDSD